MQGITQSKKVTNTFISTITHISVSLQSYTRKKDFHLTWKGKEGSKHLWAGDGREKKKVIIISFYFGAPHPPASPCLLLALSILLPHFRMGVHDWVNGSVSCKATAQKTRSFLLGLGYPALFLPNRRCACTWAECLCTYRCAVNLGHTRRVAAISECSEGLKLGFSKTEVAFFKQFQLWLFKC